VAFNVTRIDWIYTQDPDFFSKAAQMGIRTSAAINSVLPDNSSVSPSTWDVGRQLDVNLRPIQLPWMTWGARPGCVNNPSYLAIAASYAQGLLAAGATGLQHDDAGANYEGWMHGGCFCEFCMRGFTKALLAGLPPSALAQYNVTGPGWDYGRALRNDDVPEKAQPQLHDIFGDFQLNSTQVYIRWLAALLKNATGHHVPLSANNGGQYVELECLQSLQIP
jgi:hypothetical protein